MRMVTIAALFLVLGASTAHAQIDLSWSDCGTAGTERVFFGCETNTGPPHSLVASFEAPPDIEFVGISANLHSMSSRLAMPDFWKLGAGECRSNGMAVSVDFTSGPFTCADPWLARGHGGFVWEERDARSAQIRLQWALPHDDRYFLEPGVEYYAFRLDVHRDRSTGPDACAGCEAAHCFFLDHIQLFQVPERLNDPVLSTPMSRTNAFWQNGEGVWGGHEGSYCIESPPTASYARTWGTIKSLYR